MFAVDVGRQVGAKLLTAGKDVVVVDESGRVTRDAADHAWSIVAQPGRPLPAKGGPSAPTRADLMADPHR